MNNKNPAQKEDPFSEFMKSQGINVVDVTPTQKEEWEENGFPENNLIELARALYLPGGFQGFTAYKKVLKQFDDELRRVCSLAERRGEIQERKNISRDLIACYGSAFQKEGVWIYLPSVEEIQALAEARGREATITAFEEWEGKYMTETTKYYGTDKHGIDPDDLLSFASSLKSNAPKV